jgi:transcriptional regulator with XRE-family HTH domain
MTSMMTTEQQSEQVVQLIKVLLRLSRLQNRDVEKRMGLSAGYLSHLLGAKADPKLSQLLDLAAILKIHPHELFAIALPSSGPGLSQGLREMQQLMPHLVPSMLAAPPPAVDPGPTKEELEEQLQTGFNELLRRVFGASEETVPDRSK